MKTMKKVVSLFVAFAMLLGMNTFAFAGESHTIKINNATPGHTYEAYQIFKGSLGDDGTLSGISWGSGITDAGKAAYGNAATKANSLDDESDAKAFAEDVGKKYLSDTKVESTFDADEKIYTISNLSSGYYLIKDKDNSVPSSDSYTEFILKVVKDIDISPKSELPKFEKKVDDKNDSNTNEDAEVWNDSADYDIGDQVPFRLEGTVAANYDEYDHYYFAFHDVEENTLTFNPSSVKVFVDDVEIKEGFTIATNTTDGCTFEIIFADLKEIDAVEAGSKITVKYTSRLNENANFGKQGNVNKAKLEFSNNPNDEQGGTPHGVTEWDHVIVFTYKVIVNKYAEEVKAGNELAGAEFTLYKKLADGTEKAIAVEKFNDDKSFKFEGLDDGDYVLKETKAPEGYHKIADIKFTITADHTILWEGNVDRTEILTSLSGGKLATGDVETGQIVGNVINHKGIALPETGGMGTMLFYGAGFVLVAFAAIALVAKKRMDKNA